MPIMHLKTDTVRHYIDASQSWREEWSSSLGHSKRDGQRDWDGVSKSWALSNKATRLGANRIRRPCDAYSDGILEARKALRADLDKAVSFIQYIFEDLSWDKKKDANEIFRLVSEHKEDLKEFRRHRTNIESVSWEERRHSVSDV